jgi:hypothetical protein
MAQSDWAAGYELIVTIDGVAYPFATVDLERRARIINRANSKYTPGYEVNRSGLKGLTMTVEGPFKEGEAPIEEGEEYTWIYKPTTASVGLSFLGIAETVRHSNDVEDGPRLTVTIRAQSDFDTVFV